MTISVTVEREVLGTSVVVWNVLVDVIRSLVVVLTVVVTVRFSQGGVLCL